MKDHRSISKSAHSQELIPGMVISNEPGFYKEGDYGIRCENLVVVVENFDSMLSFETISFAPFDHSLIDLNLLSEQEIYWLNSYHETTRKKLAPFLKRKILNGSKHQPEKSNLIELFWINVNCNYSEPKEDSN